MMFPIAIRIENAMGEIKLHNGAHFEWRNRTTRRTYVETGGNSSIQFRPFAIIHYPAASRFGNYWRIINVRVTRFFLWNDLCFHFLPCDVLRSGLANVLPENLHVSGTGNALGCIAGERLKQCGWPIVNDSWHVLLLRLTALQHANGDIRDQIAYGTRCCKSEQPDLPPSARGKGSPSFKQGLFVAFLLAGFCGMAFGFGLLFISVLNGCRIWYQVLGSCLVIVLSVFVFHIAVTGLLCAVINESMVVSARIICCGELTVLEVSKHDLQFPLPSRA